MKTNLEIIARAVVLFCLYERCKVEHAVRNYQTYSQEECELQSTTIYRWLCEKGYSVYLTESERRFFKSPIKKIESKELNCFSHQCESIRPLLWSAGLLNELASYSGFDCDYFGETLQIHGDHNFEQLNNACQLRPEEEIALQTEVAMLWHWRAIEMGQVPKDGKSWSDCIKLIFGDEYEAVLRHIPQASQSPHDFLVGETPVSKLNKTEQSMLNIIAYWRHHAFEWIMSDDAWDEVSADT